MKRRQYQLEDRVSAFSDVERKKRRRGHRRPGSPVRRQTKLSVERVFLASINRLTLRQNGASLWQAGRMSEKSAFRRFFHYLCHQFLINLAQFSLFVSSDKHLSGATKDEIHLRPFASSSHHS